MPFNCSLWNPPLVYFWWGVWCLRWCHLRRLCRFYLIHYLRCLFSLHLLPIVSYLSPMDRLVAIPFISLYMTASSWPSHNFQVSVTSFLSGLFLCVESGFIDIFLFCQQIWKRSVSSYVIFFKSLGKELWNWSLTFRNCIYSIICTRSSSNGFIPLTCGGAFSILIQIYFFNFFYLARRSNFRISFVW